MWQKCHTISSNFHVADVRNVAQNAFGKWSFQIRMTLCSNTFLMATDEKRNGDSGGWRQPTMLTTTQIVANNHNICSMNFIRTFHYIVISYYTCLTVFSRSKIIIVGNSVGNRIEYKKPQTILTKQPHCWKIFDLMSERYCNLTSNKISIIRFHLQSRYTDLYKIWLNSWSVFVALVIAGYFPKGNRVDR